MLYIQFPEPNPNNGETTMKTLKTLIILGILGITLAATSSCRQTMRGAGEDVEDAGESIQRSAN